MNTPADQGHAARALAEQTRQRIEAANEAARAAEAAQAALREQQGDAS